MTIYIGLIIDVFESHFCISSAKGSINEATHVWVKSFNSVKYHNVNTVNNVETGQIDGNIKIKLGFSIRQHQL